MKKFSLPIQAKSVVVKSITNGEFNFAFDKTKKFPQKMELDFPLPINKSGEVDYSSIVDFPLNIEGFDGNSKNSNFKPSDFGSINGTNVEINMNVEHQNAEIEIEIDGIIQNLKPLKTK